METVRCNLCGSDKYRVIYSMPDILFHKDEWFDIVECLQCGLGYVNPRPPFDEIGKYYPSVFYDYFNNEAAYHARRYEQEARYLKGVTKKGRLLLDVGCANGDFPRFMKTKGWQVEGVEISATSQPIADFKVYRQPFSEIPIFKPHYDAITAWAVLEHVHDPMSYFRKAGEILKPDGLFVFLVTNFESISSKHLFREDIPRHLYFFTESTVNEYLAHSGMELIHAHYKDNVYAMRPVNWLRFYYYKYILGKKLKWQDIPANRHNYLSNCNKKNTLISNIEYAISNPLTIVDRMLMPVYEQVQILLGHYGIVTYVARKCRRG